MDRQLRTPLFLVLGALAVVAAAWLAYRNDSGDHATGHALGVAFGQFVVALLVVLALRWIYRRAVKDPEAITVPTTLLLVGVLGLALTASTVGHDVQAQQDELTSAVRQERSCSEQEGDALSRARARAPYALRAYSAKDLTELRAALPEQIRDGYRASDVYRRGTLVGGATAVAVVDDRQGRFEFLRGVREGATEAGGSIDDSRVAGHDVLLWATDRGAYVAGIYRCGGLVVEAVDTPTARRVWGMLAGPA
jgi:hypothetical protein